MVDPSLDVQWSAADGDYISKGDKFGQVKGSAISILTGERVALNLLQRMSGIATATAALVEAAKVWCICLSVWVHLLSPNLSNRTLFVQGNPARILETRKTVPGLRVLDKWAVLIGGGQNHRMGLYDMIMIKDNHIAAAGGIAAAVRGTEVHFPGPVFKSGKRRYDCL